MNYKLTTAALIATACFALNVHAAESKVGFVDVQKFIEVTAAGKKAKETLDAEYAKRKKDLDKRRADLEKMAQDLDKKKAVLSEEVFGKKQMELQEEGMKWQKALSENNLEMQKKQKEVLEPILEKMRGVIEKVAKEQSYAMVLEKQGQNLLYAAKDADITETVIKAFEKEK